MPRGHDAHGKAIKCDKLYKSPSTHRLVLLAMQLSPALWQPVGASADVLWISLYLFFIPGIELRYGIEFRHLIIPYVISFRTI